MNGKTQGVTGSMIRKPANEKKGTVFSSRRFGRTTRGVKKAIRKSSFCILNIAIAVFGESIIQERVISCYR